jgi:intergrase/recombinase
VTAFFTSAVQAGLPAEIVRKVTGHANPAILIDHYIRADIIAARHIAETMDRIHEQEDLVIVKKDEPDGYVN